MYWLFLLLPLLSQVHGECHYILCATLSTGVCAENDGQALVSVNRAGCQGTGYCSYEMVEAWLDNVLQRPKQLMCTPTSTLPTARAGDTNCPVREVKKDIVSGTSSLIQCTVPGADNSECQLEDGTYAECACGLDRKSYCVPDVSSTVYDDYWAECFKTGENYGRITNDDYYWYWYYRINYFLPFLTAYSCARTFFEEFVKIDDLMYSGQATLLITLGLIQAF
jgi:hypothetical protein